MNKDQTVEFSRRARDIMKSDKKAFPFIAMGYGKKAWPVITDTLRKEGMAPEKHAIVGKDLYEMLSGEKGYHLKLLRLVVNAGLDAIGGKTIVSLIDEKVNEISNAFSRRYETLDSLLEDTF